MTVEFYRQIFRKYLKHKILRKYILVARYDNKKCWSLINTNATILPIWFLRVLWIYNLEEGLCYSKQFLITCLLSEGFSYNLKTTTLHVYSFGGMLNYLIKERINYTGWFSR